MNEYTRLYGVPNNLIEPPIWQSPTETKQTSRIFACQYCLSDVTDNGIIKNGKVFCNLDCAIKYSLQESI